MSGRILYVVSCTRNKIWDRVPNAPPLVPAHDAYRGTTAQEWIGSALVTSGVRWLFLSARYGFIEPDHPIENYDVTFSHPETGPISDESLRGQVIGQRRWQDQQPLRSFRRVFVFGGEDYLAKTRAAFDGIAEVEPLPHSFLVGQTSALRKKSHKQRR